MRHRPPSILWYLCLMCFAVFSGFVACSDDDETQFDCEAHDQCLETEACLGGMCTDAPSEGDSCPDEYDGEEYQDLVCIDGQWEVYKPVPPSIDSVSAEPPTTDPGQTIELHVEVTSEVEDELQYQWTAPEGWQLVDDNEPTVDLIAHSEFGETATIEVVITDPYDQSDTGGVTTSTHEVDGPEIVSIDAEPQSSIPDKIQLVTADVHHPQELDVDYDWSIPENWSAQGELEGEEIELRAPDEHDISETVELVVTDTAGKEATASTGISTVSNPGPTIEKLDAETIAPEPEESAEVYVVADHELGHELVDYHWEIDNDDWTIEVDGDDDTIAEVTTSDEREDEAQVTVEVSDEYGETTTASLVMRTAPEENEPPEILEFYADDNLLETEESTQVHVEAQDPMDYELSYHWSIESDDDWTIEAVDVDGEDTTADLEAPDEFGSTAEITVEVIDEFGLSTDESITVHTKSEENEAPVIESLDVEQTPVIPEDSTVVHVDAIDPFGLELDYNWELTGDDDWSIVGDDDGSQIEVNAPPVPESSVEAHVTVTDEEGLSDSQSITIDTVDNPGPIIDGFEGDDEPFYPGDTRDIHVDAVHEYAVQISSYQWELDSDDDWQVIGPSVGDFLTVQPPEIPNSQATLTVEVTDELGNSAVETVTIETISNAPPVIDDLTIDGGSPVAPASSFDVIVDAYDPDGGELEYEWSISEEWQIDDDDSPTAEATSPDLSEHEATIEVLVRDEWDYESTKTLEIRTKDHTPDAFYFQLHPSGAEPNVWVESDEIFTVQNFEGELTGICHNCELRRNGGEYAQEVDGFEAGDQLQVRLESGSYGVTEEAYVELGHTDSGIWTVTTMDWEGARIFSNCGAEGAFGPSYGDCDDTYSGEVVADELATVDEGIQIWTVPSDGIYEIEALGAQGAGNGGRGARIQGEMELQKGDQLQILVGQMGELEEVSGCNFAPDVPAYGGGGGTFVATLEDEPLVVAGGGGAYGSYEEGDGQISPDGADGVGQWEAGDGGENGGAGEDAIYEFCTQDPQLGEVCWEQKATGGAGFYEGEEGSAFVEGGQGRLSSASGGFGGGGSGLICGPSRDTGGGGGYSGGGGGLGGADSTGGGGGSYNVGANPDEEAGYNEGHGQVTIDWVGSE